MQINKSHWQLSTQDNVHHPHDTDTVTVPLFDFIACTVKLCHLHYIPRLKIDDRFEVNIHKETTRAADFKSREIAFAYNLNTSTIF